MNIFSKRTAVGALVSMILAGEVMVGFTNGLFTASGAAVLYLLYYVYFLVADAFIARYKPHIVGQVLFNFAFYSVLITGLLHGELLNFLIPWDFNITLLIRIQSALFLTFVIPVVNHFTVRSKDAPGIDHSLLVFLLCVLLLSSTGSFGTPMLFSVFVEAPRLAVGFTAAALVSLAVAVRKTNRTVVSPRKGISVALIFIALIPSLPAFIFYIVAVIVASAITLFPGNQTPAPV